MADLAVPGDYTGVLAAVKQHVRQARYRAQRQVSAELIRLFWRIGRVLVEQTERAQWGDKVIQRLSADLRTEFPSARGFSPANLKSMRRFASLWPDEEAIGQQPVGQLPGGTSSR